MRITANVSTTKDKFSKQFTQHTCCTQMVKRYLLQILYQYDGTKNKNRLENNFLYISDLIIKQYSNFIQ